MNIIHAHLTKKMITSVPSVPQKKIKCELLGILNNTLRICLYTTYRLDQNCVTKKMMKGLEFIRIIESVNKRISCSPQRAYLKKAIGCCCCFNR